MLNKIQHCSIMYFLEKLKHNGKANINILPHININSNNISAKTEYDDTIKILSLHVAKFSYEEIGDLGTATKLTVLEHT